MATNIELKTYCADLEAAASVCRALGGVSQGKWSQKDTYFEVQTGRLKLRETSNGANELIGYFRKDEANSRESNYTRVAIDPGQVAALAAVLAQTAGIFVRVEKERTRFEFDRALVNLDSIEGVGVFLEIEVYSEDGTTEAANALMNDYRDRFSIRDSYVIAWSYSQITAMYSRAARAREDIRAANARGSLFLIDGCSGSGKTTIVDILKERLDPRYIFAKRHSTREKRGDTDDEYLIVTQPQFKQLIARGEFIDAKDFLFGMSYGLAWNTVLPHLLAGKNVIAPMNWGNAVHIKRLVPDAKLICLRVSEQTIRDRLMARGIHRAEEIDERLGNARRFADPTITYDLVVENETGRLEEAVNLIEAFIR